MQVSRERDSHDNNGPLHPRTSDVTDAINLVPDKEVTTTVDRICSTMLSMRVIHVTQEHLATTMSSLAAILNSPNTMTLGREYTKRIHATLGGNLVRIFPTLKGCIGIDPNDPNEVEVRSSAVSVSDAIQHLDLIERTTRQARMLLDKLHVGVEAPALDQSVIDKLEKAVDATLYMGTDLLETVHSIKHEHVLNELKLQLTTLQQGIASENTMSIRYHICLIGKDPTDAKTLGGIFPDVMGCVSAGDTVREVASRAKDILATHMHQDECQKDIDEGYTYARVRSIINDKTRQIEFEELAEQSSFEIIKTIAVGFVHYEPDNRDRSKPPITG